MNGLAPIIEAIKPLKLPRERVYLRGDVCLIQADCLDVLKLLPSGCVDAVVTDPPYGIGVDAAMHANGGTKYGVALAAKRHYEATGWDSEPASAESLEEIRRISRWQIVFGGNYFDLPPARCILVWDKEINGDYADCELAWTNLDRPAKRIRWMWNGMLRKGGEDRFHPTQKPVGVMSWAMSHLPSDCRIIADPFAGSSTTLVACIRTGRACIGIERERKYFDASVERLNAEFERTSLIEPPPPRLDQAELFQ